MSDQINKTLILSARLDTSSISSELKKMQSELSMKGIELDQSSRATLSKVLEDIITKAFSNGLEKASKGVARSAKASKPEAMSDKQRFARDSGIGSNKDVQTHQARQAKTIAREQNQAFLDRTKKEQQAAKELAKSTHAEQRKTEQAAKNLAKSTHAEQRKAEQATKQANSRDIKAQAQQKKTEAKQQREYDHFSKYRDAGNSSATSQDLKAEPKYDKAALANFNSSALGMPKEQAALRKEFDERKKVQKQLADDKEKRELGVAYRVGQATKQFFKTGKFDFLQESAKPDFRSKAKGMGIATPEEEGTVAGRVLGSGGATALRVGGAVLGAGAAVVGGAVAAGKIVSSAASSTRQDKAELYNKSYELGQGAATGNVLDTSIRSNARKNVSGSEKFVARASGTFQDLLKGITGQDYKPGEGARAELSRREQSEGEVASKKFAPLTDAFNNSVKPTLRGRVGMYQGGGMTSEGITNLQGIGASFGFGGEESLNRAQSIKSVLGNRGLSGSEGASVFSQMNENERRYGTDVGTQANYVEATRSNSTGGVSELNAMRSQTESMKKAVSAGLDGAKMTKLLETTTSYIQNNAGFANMDQAGANDSTLSLAKGFADASGRSDITNTDLDKAKSANETFRGESMAFGGVSGAGNYLGVSKALKGAGIEDTGSILSGMSMSKDASDESILKLAGGKDLSDDQKSSFISQFRDAKNNAFKNGSAGVGVGSGNLQDYLRAKEAGVSGESGQALNDSSLTRRFTGGSETTGALGTSELSNSIKQSVADFSQFTQGFTNLNKANADYEIQIKSLTNTLTKLNLEMMFMKPSAPRTYKVDASPRPAK